MPFEISLPEVPGDPAGMRQLASDLRSKAGRIEGIASSVGSAVGSMTFTGPAADTFRDGAQSSRQTLGDCAGRLQDLARLLDSKAAEVEEKQRERAAKIEELRREYAEQGILVRVS